MAANRPEGVKLGWYESPACPVVLGESLHLGSVSFKQRMSDTSPTPARVEVSLQ